MSTTIDIPPVGATVWLAQPERHHPVYGRARGRVVRAPVPERGAPEVLVEWPALASDVGPSRQWSPVAVLAWAPIVRTVHADPDGVPRYDNGVAVPTHADVLAELQRIGLGDAHTPADHAFVHDVLVQVALEHEPAATARIVHPQ